MTGVDKLHLALTNDTRRRHSLRLVVRLTKEAVGGVTGGVTVNVCKLMNENMFRLIKIKFREN